MDRTHAEIRRVFLSATASDLRPHREGVRSALRQIEAEVYLQEEWNDAAADAVDLCLRRLREECGAYMGLFGYRYGWVPKAYGKSITELECDCAVSHWKHLPDPPIFLFLPDPGSDAARELLARAEEVLQEEFPGDPDAWEESKQRQKAFRDALLASGRFIRSFRDLQDLRERAIACVSLWNQRILRAAPDQRRVTAGEIPPGVLGGIGRRPQLAALDAALLALERRDDGPAMCVAVHGRETAGQRAFAAHLAAWDGWQAARAARIGAPPHDAHDPRSLLAWALEVIAPGRGYAEPTFAGLAAAIVESCEEDPLVVILTDLGRLEGGLAAFHDGFWHPLHDALRARWPAGEDLHKFTMVAVDYLPLCSPPPGYIWDGKPDDPALDYGRVLPLPELGGITREDVDAWLRDLGVDRRRRARIADRAVVDREGRPDPTPLAVFERLNREGFWAQLA